MHRRLLAGLAFAALAGLWSPAAAQRAVDISFSQLGLQNGVVTDLLADSANRLWVASNQGVSAIAGGGKANGFPITTTTLNKLLANQVGSLAFGVLGNGENSFFGYPGTPPLGIQYGRIDANDLENTITATGDPNLNIINALSSDRTDNLWSGTAVGLVRWALGGDRPLQRETFLTNAPAPGVLRVAATPDAWGDDRAVVAATTSSLFLVRSTSPTNPIAFSNPGDFSGNVVDLTFDTDGNLWVLSSGRNVVRYNVAFDATSGQGSFPTLSRFDFNQPLRSVRSIAVDPFESRVWIATDNGAWSQVVDALGNLTPDGWVQQTTTQGEAVSVVYVDASGNAWFGTNSSSNVTRVRGLIVRFLGLNSTRYLGANASATVTLEDLRFGGEPQPNGIPNEQATVTATVGGASQDLIAVESGDSGRFGVTFALSSVGAVPGSEGTDVQVEYVFFDANQVERSLTASATWANIAKFEDDLFINGPCFLRTLEP